MPTPKNYQSYDSDGDIAFDSPRTTEAYLALQLDIPKPGLSWESSQLYSFNERRNHLEWEDQGLFRR